jgi:hypothetical protein
MEAKEKAIELVNSFKPLCGGYMGESVNRQFAKQSALIAVNEINNNVLFGIDLASTWGNYWKEVKTEIEKL